MRTRTRIAAVAATAVLTGAAAAPIASADGVVSERAGDGAACTAFAAALRQDLARYGITGAQADSYIAQRADNPCHALLTPRSAFHAGDPS